MARRPVTRHTIRLDPSFYIPAGVEDIVYDPNIVVNQNDDEYGEGDATDDTFGLETPSDVTVVSQKVVRASGGQFVIEVTFEVAEVAGADNYEILIALDE